MIFDHPEGHRKYVQTQAMEYIEDLQYAIVRERIILNANAKPVGVPMGKFGVDSFNQSAHMEFNINENIGILTGSRSGVYVLDIDNTTINGFNSVEFFKSCLSYFSENGEEQDETSQFINNAPRATTGGGGYHIFIPYNPDVKNMICKASVRIIEGSNVTKHVLHWDVKNNGGKITAPPSIHKTGNVYKWTHHPREYEPIDPPEWLYNLIMGGVVDMVRVGTHYEFKTSPPAERVERKHIINDSVTLSNLPASVEGLRGLVMRLDAERADDLTGWKKLIWALKSIGHDCERLGHKTINNNVCIDIADEWSRQSVKYVSRSDVITAWDEGTAGRIRYPSIIYWANEDSKKAEVKNCRLPARIGERVPSYNCEKQADLPKKADEKAQIMPIMPIMSDFIDVQRLYEEQTDEERGINFTHFYEFKTRLIGMSKGGALSLITVIKYLKASIFILSGGGNTSIMTKNQQRQDGVNYYTYENTTKRNLIECFNIKCPIINPLYDPATDSPNKRFYNHKTRTLAEAFKYLALDMDAMNTYNKPEFVPYLHADPTHADTFNIFSGYPLKGRATTEDFKASLFYTHTLTHTCNNNPETFEYLLNWIAHMIQKPAERAGVNVLLYGGQGTGKGTIATFIKRLVGVQQFAMYANLGDFVNKFNADQMGKLFIFLDDLSDSTKGGQEAHNIIKSRTTERTIRIEPKGARAFEINNYARYMSASNFQNSLRIEADDRRFLALHVSNENKNDSKYYKPLYGEINDNDAMGCAFLYFSTRDITTFNPAIVPNTELKQQQKEHGTPIIEFMRHLFLNDIKNADIHLYNKIKLISPAIMLPINTDVLYDTIKISGCDLYESYQAYQVMTGEKAKPRKYFYADLELLGFENKPKRVSWFDTDKLRVNVRGYTLNISKIERVIRINTNTPDFILLGE